MIAGQTVYTALLGNVTLVREINGPSSFYGWEVRKESGTLAYLCHEDFDLTEAEVTEVREALRKARASQ